MRTTEKIDIRTRLSTKAAPTANKMVRASHHHPSGADFNAPDTDASKPDCNAPAAEPGVPAAAPREPVFS
ncbi:MAG: hypothetical protein IKX11_02000, partial [Bacteroidales bacterium]|nr:hypothetical protein [Bacteroidales bacterium]